MQRVDQLERERQEDKEKLDQFSKALLEQNKVLTLMAKNFDGLRSWAKIQTSINKTIEDRLEAIQKRL